MDSFSNASASACLQENNYLEMSASEPATEQEVNEDTLSLEWLSVFMEDCFSGGTTFSIPQSQALSSNNPPPPKPPNPKSSPSNRINKFSTKDKTKRRKLTLWEEEITPLLPQTHWLAESELILPKKYIEDDEKAKTLEMPGQPRRCTHCLSQKTPQWRAGPLGPKTLCNACGVRFKSGRLLPEYRPAKSPTFVSHKHSNSHKKVMEMRMTVQM